MILVLTNELKSSIIMTKRDEQYVSRIGFKKEVYETGEVAEILGLSTKTVMTYG